jgi:hypothetical protein
MAYRRLIHLLSILLSALLLSAIALYNSYPMIFNFDTAMYIETGFNRQVGNDRPILYGLFIFVLGFWRSLWLVIAVQSLIVSLVLFYYFRYFSDGIKFLPYYIGFVAMISFFMSGSFESSWLMPDVFTPVAILCVGLLIFAGKLKRRDTVVITLIAILSIGVHNSHFYICLSILLLLLIGFVFKTIRATYHSAGIHIKNILLAMLLTISSYLILGCIHFICSGSFKSSRGGPIFLMSNLIEMGIINTYLTENCAQKNYKLCPYKDSLPNNFLWANNSPIKKTGGWRRNEAEYAAMEKDLLTTPRYLEIFLFKSTVYTLKQFFNYDMIDILKPGARVNNVIEASYPGEYRQYTHARQSTNRINFGFINFTQNLMVGICLFLYAVLLLLKKAPPKYCSFILFILLALIINAWICGTFSGVFSRYQSRVVWLLPLPLLLLLMESRFLSTLFKRIKSASRNHH